MSSVKDKLKKNAKNKLAVTAKKPVVDNKVSVLNDIDKITFEIKSNLDEIREIQEWWSEKKNRVVELKKSIMVRLIFVRDNKKNLLGSRTFEDYLVNEVGVSKGYFYDYVRALGIATSYKKPNLLDSTDPSVILLADKIEDDDVKKAVINRAAELSREDVKQIQKSSDLSPDYVSNYVPIANRTCNVKIGKDSIYIKSSEPDVLEKIKKFLSDNNYV
ncbi:MAG TPA: hypothetical protein P5123_10945 [Spirochaetota bacterium]|nr:hypothetical protein [Spirochaetota bacterium]